jgi:ribokinase
MKRIFILGSLNMDLALEMDHFPLPGETVRGHSFRNGAGGKGLNQAIAAAKLGGDVHFLGAVGDDLFGQTMVKQLQSYGVHTEHLKVREKIASGVALIEIHQGENEIGLDLGANETLTSSEIEAFFLSAEKGDIFLVQGENNPEAISLSLQKAHEKGLLTLWNPAPAGVWMKKSLPFVDCLLPNETEAAILTGSNDVVAAAKSLTVPWAVITLGGKGYFYRSPSENCSVSAVSVQVVDTTGAGDAYCGALAYFLSLGTPMKESLHLASIYASLKTIHKGTSVGMPTKKELQDYLKKNETLLASFVS